MRKILSIDGGGIRGLIPALVLAEIETKTGRRVADMFDLIAGTSTGGILALALCVPGAEIQLGGVKYSAKKMARLYSERGPEIFGRSFWKGISSVAGLADEKYSHRPLENILNEYFAKSLLADALTHVFVTAYDIVHRKPVMLKSWMPEVGQIKMAAAARATSAAPTYFEPTVLEAPGWRDELALIDGGVCVNNPALCAYAEARRLWPDDEILVVSLGTGENTRAIEYEDAKDWGLIEWARPILGVIMDGMSDAVDYQLRQILGEKFFRLQCRLETASDDMDNASQANIMALNMEASLLVDNHTTDIFKVCQALRSGGQEKEV